MAETNPKEKDAQNVQNVQTQSSQQAAVSSSPSSPATQIPSSPSTSGSQTTKTFFLTELLGSKAMFNGKKVGRLSDIIIVENPQGKPPEVTHFYIRRRFGDPSLLVPLDKISSFGQNNEIVLGIDKLEPYESEPQEGAILLKDHVLDKKVIDTEDRDVEVVYDVKLVCKTNKLYVAGVDFSRYGFLRRMGLGSIANFISSLADKLKAETISWSYVQPLPTQISSFRGDLKLNVLKEKLAGLPPQDVADMLEELDPSERMAVFNQLDSEKASDTLEEIDPNVQREIVHSLNKEKVAGLIDQMTPGQAADLLSALPWNDAKKIMKLLNEEHKEKITSIMEKQEEKVKHFSTRKFISFSPDTTAEKVRDGYAKAAKHKEVFTYIYVVEPDKRLVGVLDMKELLVADDSAILKDIMVRNVISLRPDSTMKEAYKLFKRYGFRAIPVTDKNDVLLGAVTYRDAMSLSHRFVD